MENLTATSKLRDLTDRFGSAHRHLLWIVALALWTTGSPCKVCAQDAPRKEAAVPEAVSSPNSETLGEKESLLAEVERDIRTNPSKAPDVVKNAVSADVPDPIVFAGQVVRSAINNLQRPITRVQISALILAPTKARPPAVLEIVRVAVQATPKYLHRDIVAAAIAGVPDPYYRRVDRGETLAESILNVALKARSDQNRSELSASINSVPGNTPSSGSRAATRTSRGAGNGDRPAEDPIVAPTIAPDPASSLVTRPTPVPVSQ